MPPHLAKQREQLLELARLQPARGSEQEHELDRQAQPIAKEG
jgi:hypothetical protein